MRLSMKSPVIYLTALCFLSISCQKDLELDQIEAETAIKDYERKSLFTLKTAVSEKISGHNKAEQNLPCESYLKITSDPSDGTETCSPTEFQKLQMTYHAQLASDPLAEASYNFYRNLNFVGAIIDESKHYFGADGGFTRLVEKRTRDLRRFWSLDHEIRVHGQHNETLNDREKLAEILLYFVEDIEVRDQIYPYADDLLLRNQLSPFLPDSPLFSSDGFSTFGGVIVIGDGLVEMLTEAGIDPEVAWSGVLAHEWAHQVQLNLHEDHNIAFPEPEADFLAAYYLTHKRGATYNWKSTEEFLELFYQLGNCGDTYHGDPQMRMNTAYSGYQLATQEQKKGHILSPEDLHVEFMEQMKNHTSGENTTG